MPWILKVSLILLGILILIYFFVFSKISNAIKQVTHINKIIVDFFATLVPIYLLSYLVIVLIAYLIGSNAIMSYLKFGNKVFDALFTYPFWFGLVFVVQSLFLILAFELMKFLASIIPISLIHERINFLYPRLIILTLFATALYSGIKIYIDSNSIKLNTINFKVSGINSSSWNLKIAHISDIQADIRTEKEKIEKYIMIVNSLNPDIVVFTGDLITYGTTYIPIAVEMLSKIKSKYGTYSCIGDHDYWAGLENIKREMKKQGINLYDDENVNIKINGVNIRLSIVTNIYSRRPTLETLNKLASENDADLKIFITHQPSEKLVEFANKNGYKIFLVGHTHGGQVVFSIFGYKIIPSRIETKYVSGKYFVDSMLVNVNNGLGFTFAPIRFNAPAEVTLINLSSKD